MNAFRFSLQAVLDHRLLKEEQAQRVYAEAQARLEAVRHKQDEAREAIARSVEFIRRRQLHGDLSYEERQLHEGWIAAQQNEIKALEKQASRLAEEAEKFRLALVRAMQDRTIMEKLREREGEEYRLGETRAELKLFDEIAVRDYIEARRQTAENADPAERIAG